MLRPHVVILPLDTLNPWAPFQTMDPVYLSMGKRIPLRDLVENLALRLARAPGGQSDLHARLRPGPATQDALKAGESVEKCFTGPI